MSQTELDERIKNDLQKYHVYMLSVACDVQDGDGVVGQQIFRLTPFFLARPIITHHDLNTLDKTAGEKIAKNLLKEGETINSCTVISVSLLGCMQMKDYFGVQENNEQK